MPRAVGDMKYCPRCRRWKGVDSYYKNRSQLDGLTPWCRDCFREYAQWRKQQGEINQPSPWNDIYGFIKDWPNMTLRELSVKYQVTEVTVSKWAVWLRQHGHDLPYKCQRTYQIEFAWWERILNAKLLMEGFAITRSALSSMRFRLRKKGHPLSTDHYPQIGRKSWNKGKRFYDRTSYIERCAKVSPAWVAQLEGITEGSARSRAHRCRKEGTEVIFG